MRRFRPLAATLAVVVVAAGCGDIDTDHVRTVPRKATTTTVVADPADLDALIVWLTARAQSDWYTMIAERASHPLAGKSRDSSAALSAPLPAPSDIAALLDQYFGTHAREALRVAECESGLDPQATGRAGERGLFQIHPVHRNGIVVTAGHTWDQMYQPEPNIVVAAALYAQSGWAPWTCRRVL